MRQSKDFEPNEPMSMTQFIKRMPSAIKENSPFRAMIYTCLFLAIANAILPFYTLYAIREFLATETHIAILAGLAILSTAVGNITFGYVIDHFGPRMVAIISASLLIVAGVIVLTVHSLIFLFVAWALANICNIGTLQAVQLLFAEVSPQKKLPLYVGVYTIISMAISAVFVLLLSPILEGVGFMPLFALVGVCGLMSLLLNVLVLRVRLKSLKE